MTLLTRKQVPSIFGNLTQHIGNLSSLLGAREGETRWGREAASAPRRWLQHDCKGVERSAWKVRMMNRGWGQEQVMGWGMMGVQISFASL